MKVIITGATGFIGRNLAAALHGDGMDVVATGRSPDVGHQLEQEGIDFRRADLLDGAALVSAFAPADCVIHCAGKSADWGRAAEFYDANVIGTRHVVTACQHHGIGKLIFLSTPSLYFTGRNRMDIAEDEPLPPRLHTPYGRTKLQAERELLAQANRGLQVIILRPRAVFGPQDGTITPRILQLGARQRFPLIGGGVALTDITHVDNLVEAVRCCLQAKPQAWNTVFNISNGEPIRIRDWFARILAIHRLPFRPRTIAPVAAKALAAAMELASRLPLGPKRPAFTRFSVGYMATSMTLSIANARAQLGFSPPLSNEESFQRYAASLGLGGDKEATGPARLA